MDTRKSQLFFSTCIVFHILIFIGFVPRALHAFDAEIHGFLIQRMSINMENPVETSRNDRYDVSMLRSTLYLEANAFFLPWLNLTVIGEADYEYMTEYLRRLDRMSPADLKDHYNDHNRDLREAYIDLHLGKRLFLRLGKQQVVWGETDFFHAMDVIHGYDNTWRTFLEGENEFLRKPLIMANATIQVPEANGSLQLIVRPGLDRKSDIGNSYEFRGGRWANQPNKGVDFLGPYPGFGMPFNADFKDGDFDDPNYGIRWTGKIEDFEYSIAYLHTLHLDPVVNSVFNPYKEVPRTPLAEFILKEVDLIGGTINYYVAPPIDVVVRVEASYTIDQPYNIGSHFFGGVLPGFGGVIEKDTIRAMIGFDRNIAWIAKLLRSYRPAWFSFQLFDTWIVNFDHSDDIVLSAGYGARVKSHSAFATAILAWNYNLDRVSPGIGLGYDLSYGGGFVIPMIKFIRGDHWRLLVEYDMFWDDASKKPGEIEFRTTAMGWFHNNDQLYMRLMYQF